MGAIQSGINQLFSISGLLASQIAGKNLPSSTPSEPEDLVQKKAQEITEKREFEQKVDKALTAAGQKPYYTKEKVMKDLSQKGLDLHTQRQKRRSFMKLLRSGAIPGTENLGEDALKQIQGSYTKSEKTRLLNQYGGGDKK